MSAHSNPSQSQRPRPREMLMWTIGFAMATATVEAFYMLLTQNHPISRFNPDSLWMVYIVDLVWVGLPGYCLALVQWRFPGRVSYWLFTSAIATFAWFAIVMLPDRLHTIAAGLLALGLASTTGRLAAARPRGFGQAVRRSTPVAATVGLVLVVAFVGSSEWRERQVFASLPTVSPDRPNVLILLIDVGRASHFSLHGYSRPTSPKLEEYSRSGITFEHAVATAPWTLPSHASIFTGWLPNTVLSEREAPLRESSTLAQTLTDEGYATAAFFGNVDVGHPRWGLHHGFAHYNVFSVSLGEYLLSSAIGRYLALSGGFRRLIKYEDILARRNAGAINVEFLNWLNSIDDRPFFAFLNYYDAHLPYIPPGQFSKMFDSGQPPRFDLLELDYRSRWVPFGSSTSREEFLGEVDAYDGSLAYVDQQISQLLSELDRTGLLENTLVIITSDHGEAFGEHGHADHGRSLYEPEIHVPLIMVYPGIVPEGQRVESSVSLKDIPATVFDLLGVRNRRGLPGRSLSRYWNPTLRSDLPAEPVVSQLIADNNQRFVNAILVGDKKYIRYANAEGIKEREELFSLGLDPDEHHDLANTPEGKLLLPRLRAALDSVLNAEALARSYTARQPITPKPLTAQLEK